MSSQECSTFVNALETEGDLVYFYGTWILHYAPFVVTVAAYTPRWRNTSVIAHVLFALGVFCVYSIFKNPVITYGCSELHESIPILASVGYATLLCYCMYSLLKKTKWVSKNILDCKDYYYSHKNYCD